MVVQHNLTAMNSNRMLGITTGQQAKSSEKLSSGYRINRAADDAAGLTISEKMRKQIRGLDRASTNAQDGVSAVQTAEGALTEVHDMLQRMNELAVQSANGTNSESDREAIQDEIDQLTTEIDRVAETTKFNEIYMLKGDEGTKTINLKAHDAGLKGKLVDNGNGTATYTVDALEAGDNVTIAGKQYVIRDGGGEAEGYSYTAGTGATATVDLTGWNNGATSTVTIDGVTVNNVADVDALAKGFNDDANFSAKYVASAAGDTLTITAKDTSLSADDLTAFITEAKANNADKTPAAGTANVPDEYTGDFTAKLYKAGSKEALSEADAKAVIKEGGKLYTSKAAAEKAAAPATQTEAAGYSYTAGTGATATVDLTGWTNAANSTVTIDGVTVNSVADLDALAQGFNDDEDFSAKYVASAAGTTLTITAKDTSLSADDLTALITEAKANNAAKTPAAGTANVPDEYKGDFTAKLYAEGGTEALSEEEAKEILKAGNKLYSDAAPKDPAPADNEITAEEAYKKIEEALLQANQIGDTNGTAAVVRGGAPAQAEAEGYSYTAGTGATATVDLTGWTNAANSTMTIDGVTVNSVADLDALAKGFNDDEDFSAKYVASAAGDTLTITAKDTSLSADDLTAFITDAQVGGAAKTPAAGTANVPDEYKGDFKAKLYAAGGKEALSEEDAKAALKNGDTLYTEPGKDAVTFNITTGSAEVAKTLSFNLHVGADADMTNKIQVDIDTMNSTFLGIKGIDVVGKGNDGGMAATYAIDAIADAIAKVSSQRSALGAIQNRLEHTIANVDNVVENTTAAESRIRDTDMAEEMVEYSKNNILAQAGQSMLAQANQSNQGVLSLLG